MDYTKAFTIVVSFILVCVCTFISSQGARRPSDITRNLIQILQQEEREDTSPQQSLIRRLRVNKIDTLRQLERSQREKEQRMERIRNSSNTVVCLPFWQVQELREQQAVRKLDLLLKDIQRKHRKLKAFLNGTNVATITSTTNSTALNSTTVAPQTNANATAANGNSGGNSSEDSDEAEQDDDQTEEDDSESPNDDSNQSSRDNSEGDPDDS